MTITGNGSIAATAILSSAPTMKVFRRGRDFASWLWPVPKQNSTGGKARLGRSCVRRAPLSQRRGVGGKVGGSFISGYCTYGTRRVRYDLLAERESCGLHRAERLMRTQCLKARPRVSRAALGQGPAIGKRRQHARLSSYRRCAESKESGEVHLYLDQRLASRPGGHRSVLTPRRWRSMNDTATAQFVADGLVKQNSLRETADASHT